jgi:hypothetical protein
MAPPALPEHRIVEHDDHVVVWMRGCLDSLAQMRGFQHAIEAVLMKTRLRRAIFDNRDTEAPTDQIRDAMFAWVAASGCFDAVALVVESVELANRVDMNALARRVRMRAFGSIDAAAEWLRDPDARQ